MAKVEITIPIDLLKQIDDAARGARETRDEFLRRIAEKEVEESNARLRKELEDLMDAHPLDLGGNTAADLIREGRDSR